MIFRLVNTTVWVRLLTLEEALNVDLVEREPIAVWSELTSVTTISPLLYFGCRKGRTLLHVVFDDSVIFEYTF